MPRYLPQKRSAGGGGGGWASLNSTYFNSYEVGGDGSDSTVLLADDFHRGNWYLADYNGSNPPSMSNTFGWAGTVYANPITPTGAAVSGPGTGSDLYYATHGYKDGTQGGRNMADHNLYHPSGLSSGYDDVYVRFYTKPLPGYLFSDEKVLAINPPNWAGGGGIKWGCLHFNPGTGSQQATGSIQFSATVPMDVNIPTGVSAIDGHWYFIEMRLKLNAVGSANGLLQIWVDDCGTGAAPTLNPTGSPTLRVNRTDMQYDRASAAEVIGNFWFENWANNGQAGTLAGSLGERYLSRIMAKSSGPIGFAAS